VAFVFSGKADGLLRDATARKSTLSWKPP